MSADLPYLLTVSGCAAFLGLDRHTVSEMIRRGEIPFIPWRGSKLHKRIIRDVVIDLFKKQQVYAGTQHRRAVDRRRS